MICSARKDIFNFHNYNSSFKMIIAFLVFFISIAYSALNSSLMVTGNLVYRTKADIRITDVRINGVTNGGLEQYSPKYTKNTVSLGMKLPNLDSTVTYEVTVKNSSDSKYIISAITDEIPRNTNISYTHNYTNMIIEADSTIKILLTYRYNSDVTTVTEGLYEETKIVFIFGEPTLYGKMKSDYESGKAELYTGDKSIFIGDKEVYYYKGETFDNNVLFAGFCWRIFRTTETGGVKMIYNGVADSNGRCTNTGEASTIGNSNFNSNKSSPAYVGYMYNLDNVYTYKKKNVSSSYLYGNSFTYSGETYTLTNTQNIVRSDAPKSSLYNYHYICWNESGTCETLSYIYQDNSQTSWYIDLTGGTSIEKALDGMLYADNVNTTNSTIKTAIDNWYEKNMTGYTSYLEDAIWCNDRSMNNKSTNGWNPNGGNVDLDIRYSNINTTNLTCQNRNDRFTINNTTGNGKLTYPVGLVTKQEQNLAYYLSNSPISGGTNSDLTLTPMFYSNYTMGFYNVKLNGDWDYSFGNGAVRPVVAIKTGVEYNNGDGTTENPFQIAVLDISSLTVDSTDSWNGVNVKANLNSSSDNVYAQDVTICLKQESGTCEDADYKSPEEATLKLTGVSFNGKTVNIKVSVKDSAGNEISKTVPYTLYTECQDVNLVETTLKEEGACSKACGGGTRTDVYNSKDKNSGNACPSKTISVLNISCNTQECCSTTSEEYSAWSDWGGCSASCGGGSQTRSRTFYRYSAYNGGLCSTGTEYQRQACNTQECCSSVTYSYGAWGGFGACSASCGGGVAYQYRTVYAYSSYNGGYCSSFTQSNSTACNTQACAPLIYCWTASDGRYGFSTENEVPGHWYYVKSGYGERYYPDAYNSGCGELIQYSDYLWFVHNKCYGTASSFSPVPLTGQTISHTGLVSNVCYNDSNFSG